jgi:rRNA maturation endonuclease Nob1
VKKPGQTNVQLQTELLRTIRDEAEHNLSQQLYINKDTWKIVKQSKEETIKIVNQASTKVDPKGDSSELSKAIFEIMAELGNPPTDKAIEQMKTDVQKYF